MNAKKNKYYYRLDVIRVISCVGVLLYHLNLLKGGFIAVCVFLTLSGYLSCLSFLHKSSFSILEYYISRIKKIYVPLLVVSFITLAVLSLFPSINWLTLKPETTSVLFGYNNFWQLKANLDYFARHIDSPFMHMWYISLLLQFELVFPIFFLLLKKIGDVTKKIIPSVISFIFGIVSFIYFYKMLESGNIMGAYYHTFARSFSCFFGISFGFFSFYYKSFLSEKIGKVGLDKVVFFVYFILLFLLFFMVNVGTKYLSLFMLLSSLIGVRLIDYGTLKSRENGNGIVKFLSSISYEIYLVQYPIIFIFQNISLDYIMKIICVILLTLVCSWILHFSFYSKKKIRWLFCFLLLGVSIYGGYQYVITKDYTEEMKNLEKKLAENKLLAEKKKVEYQNRLKEEQEKWNLELDEFNVKEEELKEKVTHLSVVGIGDSVMLGASNALYKVFPNGYFDGKVNRTEIEARDILIDLKNKGMLGDVLIFNLGTNGECAANCKKRIMEVVGNRLVFWVNATNPDYDTCNPNIEKAAREYSNIHVVDWVSVANQHPEYLAADRVHVGGVGARVYSQTVYDAIYQYYLQELNKMKNEKIAHHDEMKKERITFFGNDLLLNLYEYIQDDYVNDEFVIDDGLTYEVLINELQKRKETNTLSNYLVFVLDQQLEITDDELENLEKQYQSDIYIVTVFKRNAFHNDHVHVISLFDEVKVHKDYLGIDKLHLTKEGNLALKKLLFENLKK